MSSFWLPPISKNGFGAEIDRRAREAGNGEEVVDASRDEPYRRYGFPASASFLARWHTALRLAREMEGIGEAKARAIVEHRQRNGAFKSVDELALVKGIGAKTLAVNRPRLTVGTAAAAKTSPRTPGPAAAR